jgi:DNA topoisomerase-1
MKNLVVVESPAKARTIERYLGKGYVVRASKGHVKDLPKKELGVDVDAGFVPRYVTVRGKGNILKEIRKLSRDVERVYLAPDPDREGEAIAWHIANEIGYGKKRAPEIERVLINEITKQGIQEAFAHPQQLDENRYNSQQARRILDRLVGYQLSPLLWEKVRRGLSAGRVQSVAVRLVVDREREIEAFDPVEYWRIEAHLKGEKPPSFWARLLRYQGEELTIGNAREAERHFGALETADYSVDRVQRKKRRRNPQAPFITSRLQQEAARKLRMSPKRTMMVAQKLYEGVDLGGDEGRVGLITYMRTDSTRVSSAALTAVRAYIRKQYGKEWAPSRPRHFAKSKKAQDAHEAIRPTSVDRSPEAVKSHLKRDEYRLYDLIWKRFVASQMSAAIYDATIVDVKAGDYQLRATGSVLRFAGFLALYQEGKDDDDNGNGNGDKDRKLPQLKEGEPLEKLDLSKEQRFTKPPPRFTEASLVRELEERGIGRPSTYASIITTIRSKHYVEKQKGRFVPTELGTVVTDLLVENFPHVLDVEFTAGMEGQLDKIEDGRLGWVEVLKDFHDDFSKTLDRARQQMRNLKRETIPTDIECDKCGAMMVVRWGKNGSFLACSAYPDCRNTREFSRDNGKIVVVEPTLEPAGECDECGAPMVIKTGKFGRFRACTRYPDCKNTAPIPTGVTCPTCGKGDVVEKRSRRGKTFYGCERYPDCKYATWDEPIPQPCRSCDSPFIARKVSRSGRERIVCPSCGSSQKLQGEGDEATAG